MVDEVIIIGGHIQALGLARQAKSIGVKVTLCIADGYSVARFSNSVSYIYIYGNFEFLYNYIRSKGSSEKHILLFPTNDESIEFLCMYYAEFQKCFYLGIPSPDIVELFADKRNTYLFSIRNKIPCPKTWCLKDVGDVEKYRGEFNFPVIVKPAVMYAFHDLFGKKAYKCDSYEELLETLQRIVLRFPIELLMVQEFLHGGPKNLYSYGCCAVNGKPKVALIANRIRQNPYVFGNSTTFAVTKYVENIETIAEKILSATSYTGLAEIEFMYDEDTKEYKFLEINTRAWKWHGISNNFGFGFLSEYIKYLNGIVSDVNVDYSQPRAWVERITDFAVSLKAVSKGMLSINEIYQSYKLRKTSAVWSSKDIFPALMYLFMSPILFFKRH